MRPPVGRRRTITAPRGIYTMNLERISGEFQTVRREVPDHDSPSGLRRASCGRAGEPSTSSYRCVMLRSALPGSGHLLVSALSV